MKPNQSGPPAVFARRYWTTSRWLVYLLATTLSLVVTHSLARAGEAAPSPSAEEFRALLQRVQELEAKLKALEEATRAASAKTEPASGAGQLTDLDQRVKVVERKQELEQEAAQAKAAEAPKVTIGSSGFAFSSADENFKLKLRGLIQADARFYLDDQQHSFTDTFLLNRVRPIVEGTVYKNFDFRITPDFGQGRAMLYDAFIDAHVFPWLSLRAGKFKGPVGLERLQSGRDLLFVERGLPTDLVPNRDVGLALHGDFLDGIVGYEAGIFNGAADGSSADFDDNDSKDFEGRVFAQPFKKSGFEPLEGLGVGLAGTTGHEKGNLPGFKTAGQQTFFTFSPGVTARGNRSRIVPQGYYYWGPFGLLAEYVVSREEVAQGAFSDGLEHQAWQVAATYVLTGEKASYAGVIPEQAFDPARGRWGAFELAARVGQLKVDPKAFENHGTIERPAFLADAAKSASEATAWGVGLNWYLNRNVRFLLDYEQTEFEGGAAVGDRPKERVIFSRIQLAF